MDPRKRLSEQFLSVAPGRSDLVDLCVLDGHYYKSVNAAKRIRENTLTKEDREFINEALINYAGMLVEQNFWNLAHLSKKQALNDFDPLIADAVYRICLNVDELRAILYFDSVNADS